MHSEVRSVRLERLRVQIGQRVSKHLLDAQVEIDDSFVCDEIEFRVHGYVWAKPVETYSFEFPEDWWAAFKQRWFPRPALSRWPVKMIRRTVNVAALYPTLRYLVPDHDPVLRVDVVDAVKVQG